MKFYVGDDLIDLDKPFTLRELWAIQEKTGLDMRHLQEGLLPSALKADALLAAVWTARKRVETALKFEDVDFTMEDIRPYGEPTEPAEPAEPASEPVNPTQDEPLRSADGA